MLMTEIPVVVLWPLRRWFIKDTFIGEGRTHFLWQAKQKKK